MQNQIQINYAALRATLAESGEGSNPLLWSFTINTSNHQIWQPDGVLTKQKIIIIIILFCKSTNFNLIKLLHIHRVVVSTHYYYTAERSYIADAECNTNDKIKGSENKASYLTYKHCSTAIHSSLSFKIADLKQTQLIFSHIKEKVIF